MIVNLRDGGLFVEGLKMRPTAERVLRTIAQHGGMPSVFQQGVRVAAIAASAGLSQHQVRARLCDLRRLGLVESDRVRPTERPTDEARVYGHFLTREGDRWVRAALGLDSSHEPPTLGTP